MNRPKNIVLVISAHGYGHASREMEVMRRLLVRDRDVHITALTAAPQEAFAGYLGPLAARVEVVSVRADVGLVQKDSLTMDRDATIRALDALYRDPEAAERALAARLAPLRPSVIVADIPAVAMGAAARLGVPSVAIGNFDWAAIYAFYAESDPAFAPFRDTFLAWHARATRAVLLQPGVPLMGFADVTEVPPVVRRADADRDAVRRSFDLGPSDRAVVAAFGGCGLSDLERRLPRVPGIVWILSPPLPPLQRPDVRFVEGAPFVALLAAADALFGKPGYGTYGEAVRHKTRVLAATRDDFPEGAWLDRWIDRHAPAVHVDGAALGTHEGEGLVRDGLARLFAMPDTFVDPGDGAEHVAAIIERASMMG